MDSVNENEKLINILDKKNEDFMACYEKY